jgi:hypothetical protein
MAMRKYPVLSDLGINARPLSIVCIHFSDEFFHNFSKSECVNNSANQIIVVDNRSNVHFANLGEAMNAGICQAMHPIVVIAHEDVLLPEHWQQNFQMALRDLEANDPDWGLLGVGGWSKDHSFAGHVSDPHGYHDTLGSAAFSQVDWIDEQLIVLKSDGGILPDPNLPSIHNIGLDLAATAKRLGRATYVINAPTIHKYADAEGKTIESKEDSPKIMNRSQFAYKAEEACSREYFIRKWNDAPAPPSSPLQLTPDQKEIMERPLVLVARGGGGSRLLSTIAQDLGCFVGETVNDSGDTIEMVMSVYMGIIRKFTCKAQWQKDEVVPDLRRGAVDMLRKAAWPEFWGFKLPESIYLISEIMEAFPRARFLHLLRDPLSTCLRRTHMTGRIDNEIGRVVIPPAYDHVGRARSMIQADSPPMRMAVPRSTNLTLP